jgi:uncharacterized OB-fold protein
MALTERLEKTTQVGCWTGEIPLEYIYTYGRAGEAYFRTLKDKGTFLGACCNACRITYVPPRIYCEKCFARLEESYIEVGVRGAVHTFTVLYKNLDGSRKEKPLIMAMVELDGTDGGVVHCLGGVEPEEVYIGMEVEAVLKPKAERRGAITDIEYFKPVPPIP